MAENNSIDEVVSEAVERIADAIETSLMTPYHTTNAPKAERASLADVVQDASDHLRSISYAITAPAAPGHDETGGSISSLTEAVMGITASLCKVADGLHDIAEAIRNHG